MSQYQDMRPAPVTRGAWLVLAATALAGMMDGIDATALAVANPVLAHDLHASLPALEALTVGYMLAMAMALVPAGALADRIGHRRVFMAGLAGFVISSLLVGLSGSVSWIIALRVLQGASGAMLAASSLALLRHAFTPERLKVAIGLWSSGLAVAVLAGPFIGGVLVQYVHWRAIFFVNVPIGALAFTLVLLSATRDARHPHPSRFDAAGAALLTCAVFTLVAGITRAQVDGWSSAVPLAALAAAAVLTVAFGLRERRARDPLLPPDVVRTPRLTVALAVIMAAGLAHFGTAFYYALYLQQIRGLTPVAAGAGLLPLIGLIAVGAPASGLLNRRYGPRLPIIGGLGLLCAGLCGLSAFGADAPLPVVLACVLPMGLGIGLAQPTAVEVAISAAPPAVAGRVAGLQQTVLMISGSLGAAIFGSIIAASAPEFADHAVAVDAGRYLTGFGHATLLGAALTLLATAVAAATFRTAATAATAAS
ncbi:MFS transporter [Pseudonocardia sp. DSM 110487]|uniref:MFS transporter n=1 Tax=Pseudonocardia sp. DSM 110487 TaxID=2865833 RepID=UPI001C69B320|nr:MFS transporter [Pseudonocardia sp. DSM 110487]QYN37430.1 MFS transporter [Pseudonocardia sp. DSM 110487]